MWGYLTVGAAAAAGIGFVVQFMGLRGLTYPCSIAQLIAILLMALVRAVIRRRLGHEVYHCPAPARFEVDFLAIRVVCSPDFREFETFRKKAISELNKQRTGTTLNWKVKTASEDVRRHFYVKTIADARNFFASVGSTQTKDAATGHRESGNEAPAPMDVSHIPTIKTARPIHDDPGLPPPRSDQVNPTTPSPPTSQASTSREIDTLSSQHLVRVRERLGNLCKWPSEALESARSLVKSVEACMDDFPELRDKKSSLDWIVETSSLVSGSYSDKSDFVTIPLKKTSEGRWQVGIGTLEAILSLWMAGIETQAADRRKDLEVQRAKRQDWRRNKAGVDLRYEYYRILGDDNKGGTLKRDLSWWVDETIVERACSRSKMQNSPSNEEVTPGNSSAASVPNSPAHQDSQQPCSEASTIKETSLVIGFNGYHDKGRLKPTALRLSLLWMLIVIVSPIQLFASRHRTLRTSHHCNRLTAEHPGSASLRFLHVDGRAAIARGLSTTRRHW